MNLANNQNWHQTVAGRKNQSQIIEIDQYNCRNTNNISVTFYLRSNDTATNQTDMDLSASNASEVFYITSPLLGR